MSALQARFAEPEPNMPGETVPHLSVVVVVFNMAREAPRTLLSLSPAYQRDIAAGDYEIIVVDNGSEPPFDPAVLAPLGENFRLIQAEPLESRTASLADVWLPIRPGSEEAFGKPKLDTRRLQTFMHKSLFDVVSNYIGSDSWQERSIGVAAMTALTGVACWDTGNGIELHAVAQQGQVVVLRLHTQQGMPSDPMSRDEVMRFPAPPGAAIAAHP